MSRLARFAWTVLAVTVGVILWGAYVRATGSGAGCGSHWPLCNGEVLPRGASAETLIEYSHRLTSGLALLLVAILAVWTFRARPRGHPARRGAGMAVAFMLGEVAIGAGLVLLELVGGDDSVARGIFTGLHLANTFLLLAALALTAFWAGGGGRLELRGRAAAAAAAALAGVLAVGATGAIAALGDTLFRSESLAAGWRQDLSPAAHIFVRLRVLHPALAAAVAAYLLYLPRAFERAGRKPGPRGRRWGRVLTLLVFCQLGAGTLNIALLAPVGMQIAHLLLADALWIALVLFTASALARRETALAAGLREPASPPARRGFGTPAPGGHRPEELRPYG